MKVLRKIVSKTKIDRVRSQQIGDSCDIQTIYEQTGSRRGEWDEHVTRMDAERLVKFSMDIIPAGRSPGRPKRSWGDSIPS